MTGDTYSFDLVKPIVFSRCKDQKEAWEYLQSLLNEQLKDTDILVGHPIFDLFKIHKLTKGNDST